jgi:tRNA A37 threonylcarbamoyladenosine modification protein TsaB
MTAPHNGLTLAIETSNPSAHAGAGGPGVALGVVRGRWDIEVIAAEPLAATARHDDDLMPAIDRLFGRTGAERSAIARVAVSVGPGGYTALRVAVATGKMIAEAVGGRCVAVPTALCLALRAPADPRGPIGVLLASKADTAWCCVLPPGWLDDPAAAARGRIISAADVEGLGAASLIGDRFVPEAIRARASQLGIPLAEPRYDPAACLEASSVLEPVDPALLVPIYPREPDAVTLWRKLHGGG